MSVVFHQKQYVDGSVTRYHAVDEGTVVEQWFDAEPAIQMAEWYRNGHLAEKDREIRPVMFMPDTLFYHLITKAKLDTGDVAMEGDDCFMSKKNIQALMKEYSKFNAVDKL